MSKQKDRKKLEEVKNTWSAMSMSFSPWWSPQKGLNQDEKFLAAGAIGLEDRRKLKGGRKEILDTTHPAWRRISSKESEAYSWWNSTMFPYVVPGQRLFRIEHREDILTTVQGFRNDLLDLSEELDEAREELLQRAKKALGSAFDASLYPTSWIDKFNIDVREYNIIPSDYLLTANEQAYNELTQRLFADLEGSNKMFEHHCMRTMQDAMLKLSASLPNVAETGQVGGGALRSTGANIEQLHKLFNRISQMKFEGTALFKKAVKEAQDLVDGVKAEDFRKDESLREDTSRRLERLLTQYKELQGKVIEKAAS